MSASAYARAQAAQRAAADPRASVFVTANAGSGKTKVLIDRVARLLLTPGAEPACFLCITYTKAAAAEMQRRLFERLGAWCVADDDRLRATLAELLGRDTIVRAQDLARARGLFARALETPGGLKIQTIHAFCERLLRRFPLESGVAAGFTIADEETTRALLEEAWAEAAEDPRAAEGIARFAERLDAPTLSALFQALTTKRAALEALTGQAGGLNAARASLLARHGAREDRAGFVHRLLAEIPWPALREAGAALAAGGERDRECAARIAAAERAPPERRAEAYFAIFQTAKGGPRAHLAGKAVRARAPGLETFLRAQADHAEHACKTLRAIDRAEDAIALAAVGAALNRAYAKAKRAAGVLDFEDLIVKARALLERSASAAWVLYKLDGGIDHILIDEGQDTSPDQWALLAPLRAEFFAGRGAREKARTVFAVGDPKQSIYSFQGADPARFSAEARALALEAAAADRAFAAPGMAMSFRSTPTVLALVDGVFEDLPLGGDEASASEILRHDCKRVDQPGVVELWPLALAPERPEPQAWDAPRDAGRAQTAPAVLAEGLARRVREWIASGVSVWGPDGPRPMRPGDVIALVRQRGPLFEQMLKAFKGAGLPVAGADRMVLREELAVEDLLALMRVALDPSDDLSLACALKGPFIGLDDDDLMELCAAREPGIGVIDRLRGAENPRWRAAYAEIAHALRRRGDHPHDFLAAILEREVDGVSGWGRLLARLGVAARDPTEALLARALEAHALPAASLHHFLHAIAQDEAALKREMDTGGDAIRVMTVHGAKGLEAPVVILADTTGPAEGRNPSGLLTQGDALFWSPGKGEDDDAAGQARAAMAQAAEAEHLRLLYVGLTRARDRLIVCGAARGNLAGGRAARCWHQLVEQGFARLPEALPCETPFGEGLRLGAPLHAPAPRAAHAVLAPAPAWARRPATEEPSAARPLAPSAHAARPPPAFSPSAEGRRRFHRGRMIHALLQRLPEVVPPARHGTALRWLEGQGVAPEAAAAFAAEALGVLEHAEFAPVFGPGSRAEAQVTGLIGGRRVTGAVDRLVVRATEILVVDFKTDRPAPADPEDMPEAYVAQLCAYRAVLAQAFPGRLVRCALIWTEGPVLTEASTARLDAAQARLFQ